MDGQSASPWQLVCLVVVVVVVVVVCVCMYVCEGTWEHHPLSPVKALVSPAPPPSSPAVCRCTRSSWGDRLIRVENGQDLPVWVVRCPIPQRTAVVWMA